MQRRTFLRLAIGSVAVAFWELQAQTPPIGDAATSEQQTLLQVLRDLLPEELVDATVAEDTAGNDADLLEALGLEDNRVLVLGSAADDLASDLYKLPYLSLDSDRRQQVLGLMMTQPDLKRIYERLAALVFSDEAYGLNKDERAWRPLGYESFQFWNLDNWQSQGGS